MFADLGHFNVRAVQVSKCVITFFFCITIYVVIFRELFRGRVHTRKDL